MRDESTRWTVFSAANSIGYFCCGGVLRSTLPSTWAHINVAQAFLLEALSTSCYRSILVKGQEPVDKKFRYHHQPWHLIVRVQYQVHMVSERMSEMTKNVSAAEVMRRVARRIPLNTSHPRVLPLLRNKGPNLIGHDKPRRRNHLFRHSEATTMHRKEPWRC